MANTIKRHITHIKSKVVMEGKPKLPTAADIMEGEIAVNFAKGLETLSIKNESGNVVTFSSDNYYTEQKLGSGFTGANSANTVTKVIEDNEFAIATALNDLNENKLDASAYTPTDLSNYYTKSETDARDLWVSGSGTNAVAQKGGNNIASGYYSHAEGYSTTANGNNSHAEGDSTIASGESSHAEGYNTKANGRYSHAEGFTTTANGNYSHAEGYNTRANGRYSHAEGTRTTANGNYSHAEGSDTIASGESSHAEGYSTVANNQSEHASGQYNVSSSASTTFGHSGNTLFSVGNGTDSNAHNAFEIRQNGDIYFVDNEGNDAKLQTVLSDIEELSEGTSAALNHLNTSKQDKITASGLLKGNGSGTVSAAVAGTDYQAPLTFNTAPSSSNKVATMADIPTTVSSFINDANYVSQSYVDTEVDKKLTDYSKKYFTIVSLVDSNTIGWKASSSSLTKAISISLDNGATWTSVTSTTSGVTLATLSANQKMLVKGINSNFGTSSMYNYFTSTGNFNVEGNIMSLIYGDDFIGQTTLDSAGYNFRYLFISCSYLIDASNLILPATTLSTHCYYYMFYGCTSLTKAPELPATTLATYCYTFMFNGCTSLTKAPELPATTLSNHCYDCMFRGCTSLTKAPELPATTLDTYCYGGMFRGCTSLTKAPELPATTLSTFCYYQMFRECTSLTKAPELPATTLAVDCYNAMFYGCTSLTKAPELPATTVADDCYNNMFYGCTSLTKAPELPATTLAYSCYNSMFYGCTSLNYIKCLATDISASNCLNSWVSSVSSTGTFVKADSMSSWTTGTSGIPTGWNVFTESEWEEVRHYEMPAEVKDALGINSSTGSATKYLNEQGSFVFENAYKTSIVVGDLIGSSISTNTKNALIALRSDSNSYGRLILLKSNYNPEVTSVPAYISSYGSQFDMWFNYQDKFYHIEASPDNSQWSVTTLSKQDKITASGLLKGNGNGGVSAAVAGTDYQAPLTFNTAPSSSNKVATMADIPSSLPANGGAALTSQHVIAGNQFFNGLPNKGVGMTVSQVRDAIKNYFANYAEGIGSNIYVSTDAIYNWTDLTHTVIDSSVYCFIKVGGGYQGSSYGQFLLSSYDTYPLYYCGLNSGVWSPIVKISSDSDLSSYLPLSGGTITGVTEVTADFSTYSNFKFKSVGSGTYDIGCILKDSNGLHIESPRASDSASASPLGVHIEARGGQYSFVKAAEYRQTYTNPTSDTSYTINSNTEYFLNPVTGNLSITLGSPTAGIKNEYNFQFDIPISNTSCTVTMPSSIIWASEPTFEAGNHYEVSIKYDNIGQKYYGLCTAFFNATLADRLTKYTGTTEPSNNTYYVVTGTYNDGASGTISNPLIYSSSNNYKLVGSNSSYTIQYYDIKSGSLKTKTYTSSNYSTVVSTIGTPIKNALNTKYQTSRGFSTTPQSTTSSVTYYIEL